MHNLFRYLKVDMEDFPNDYSNPNAIASEFEGIEDRLRNLENEVKDEGRLRDLENEVEESKGDRGVYAWGLGTMLAMILSWSRKREHFVLHRAWDRQLDLRDLLRFHSLGLAFCFAI
jgi:hypothetical protein